MPIPKAKFTGRVGEHDVRGRTGLWWVSTRGRVNSPDLGDHLACLLGILFPPAAPGMLGSLRGLMEADGLRANVDCFWHGARGARVPEIPEDVRAVFARLPAPIELDFDTD